MSHNDLLRIQNLKVCAGEKEILHGIDLDIHENEVHVLMGPNGTGKSTLVLHSWAILLTPSPAATSSIRDRISTKCRITNVPRTAFSCRSRTPLRFRASPSVRLSAVHWKPRPASVSVCSASKRNWKKKWHCSRWIRPMQSVTERGLLRRRKEKD